MTSTEIAQYAERHSASTNTPGSVIAPVRVEHIRALPHTATVYNITVLDCPEYFANGILVHNCADAARYIMSTGPYWRQRPRNPARLKADGGELQFAQDRQTPTEEELNIREHMRISKLYAEGRLPGWT